MRFFVLVLSAVAVVHCNPVVQDESVIRLVLGNFVNCMNSDLNLCLKEHALRVTERIGTVRNLKIIDGITIVNNGHKEGRSLEPLSTEPDIRNKQLSQRLWDSTSELLQNSALELSYPLTNDNDESRAIDDVEEGRGKKKEKKQKIKMLIPLVILGAVKAIALVIFFIGVIAASLFKLAALAKIAFIVKAIAIIKALIAKKHQNQEHEEHVWASPHEEHGHGGGWEGGWSRSRKEAQNLAYSAYKK